MFCNTLETYTTKSWKLPRLHFNYHDELETTTQDEQGMNRLGVNAQIFFLCRNVYSGSFYHFHRQMISNSIEFDRYGLKFLELWGKLVRCSVGKH